MKYFEKLPKRNYETTLGSFNISDFFSYYKFNIDTISKKEITVDSKTTLIEAAGQIYDDVNSFWLFLLANKWFNPFTLLEDNVDIILENKKNNNSILIKTTADPADYPEQTASADLIYLKPGSILVKNSGNTYGNPWDYSYVGNFDLNSDFSIVQSTNFYTKRIELKYSGINQTLFTDGSSGYFFVTPNSSGNSAFVESNINFASIEETKTINTIKTTVYQKENFKQEFKDLKKDTYDEIPTQTSALPSNITPTQINFEEDLKLKNKKIFYFELGELSKATNKLITVKYT
jgi:hypothetical protein